MGMRVLLMAEYLDFKVLCVLIWKEFLGRVYCVYISFDGTFMHKGRIYVIILICSHFLQFTLACALFFLFIRIFF